MQLVSLHDLEQLARERMLPEAFAYVASGSWDEVTLAANVAAFRRTRLLPRAFADVATCDPATTLLGRSVAAPFGMAPMAMQGLAHADGEVASARACTEAGVLFIASTLSSRSLEDIAAVGDGPRWFQLYVHRDRGVSRELLQRARVAGYDAIVVTGDLPVVGHRDTELRAGFRGVPSFGNFAAQPGDDDFVAFVEGLHDQALTWADFEWIRKESGLPLVAKGILRAEEAQQAVLHGAAAVIVSNHGGRQLDRAPATLDVLRSIVTAVDGRAEVCLDGGVRRGLDVIAALALGARAVFVGRPLFQALAVGGSAGVAQALALLHAELRTALRLVGARTPTDLDHGVLAELT